MSSISYLLSRNNNLQQLTLAPSTKEKFISSGIFQGETDEDGFDKLTLPNNKNLRLDFPNCIFNRIPNTVNSTAFLEYLGVKPEVAKQIFTSTSVSTHGMVDGEALFHQLRLFAQGLENTLNPTYFTTDLISDVNRLKHSASQVPGIMNNYLAQATTNKSFNDLTNYDYLSKIYSERIANLLCLGRAINEYINNM